MPLALVRRLLDQRIGIRYATLFSLGVATFVLCHTISYWWLPEGLLRGRSLGALATGGEAADSFRFEWGRIAVFNVMVVLLFYVAANLMRFSNGVPLGYNTVIVMQAYFGVVTGTNSFTLSPDEGKIAPSFYWLLTPGFYELAAYALATASTYEITRWQDVRVRGVRKAVRFRPSQSGWCKPQAIFGLALALLTLIGTSGWEAHNIIDL